MTLGSPLGIEEKTCLNLNNSWVPVSKLLSLGSKPTHLQSALWCWVWDSKPTSLSFASWFYVRLCFPIGGTRQSSKVKKERLTPLPPVSFSPIFLFLWVSPSKSFFTLVVAVLVIPITPTRLRFMVSPWRHLQSVSTHVPYRSGSQTPSLSSETLDPTKQASSKDAYFHDFSSTSYLRSWPSQEGKKENKNNRNTKEKWLESEK